MKNNSSTDRSITLLDMDGEPQELRVGDWVEYKSGSEQSGEIKDIDHGSRSITVETEDDELRTLRAKEFWL